MYYDTLSVFESVLSFFTSVLSFFTSVLPFFTFSDGEASDIILLKSTRKTLKKRRLL